MPELDRNYQFTRNDVELVATKHGVHAAADFLLLIPPDRFDGDYMAYYNELIERGMKTNAGHEEEKGV